MTREVLYNHRFHLGLRDHFANTNCPGSIVVCHVSYSDYIAYTVGLLPHLVPLHLVSKSVSFIQARYAGWSAIAPAATSHDTASMAANGWIIEGPVFCAVP